MTSINTALEALKLNDLHLLEQNLQANSNLAKEVDDDNRTIFHWACAWNKLGFLPLLKNFSSDLDHQDDISYSHRIYCLFFQEGWTPLHSASSAGLDEVVEYLIRNGAKVDIRTSSKCIPLHYASSKGHLEIMKSLVRGKSPINARDKYGNTPLSKSCSNGHLPAVLYLLSIGAHCMTQESGYGDTPLHIAVRGQHKRVCIALCEHEPMLLITPNSEGVFPIELASPDISKVLEPLIPKPM